MERSIPCNRKGQGQRTRGASLPDGEPAKVNARKRTAESHNPFPGRQGQSLERNQEVQGQSAQQTIVAGGGQTKVSAVGDRSGRSEEKESDGEGVLAKDSCNESGIAKAQLDTEES